MIVDAILVVAIATGYAYGVAKPESRIGKAVAAIKARFV